MIATDELIDSDEYFKTLCRLHLERHIAKEQSRYNLASQLGLNEITIREAVETIVGKVQEVLQLRQDPGHTHNLFYWGGDKKHTVWDIKCGNCVYQIHPEQIVVRTVTAKIPYGILLKIKELMETKCFDCFFAIAPFSAWAEGDAYQKPDPVIVASVLTESGCFRHFFVARWNQESQCSKDC